VKNSVTWINIQIRETEKELLDEFKQQEKKRRGKNPSYSDIIDEMFEGTEIKEKKKKENREIMDLF